VNDASPDDLERRRDRLYAELAATGDFRRQLDQRELPPLW
jgi:hypothetical protein